MRRKMAVAVNKGRKYLTKHSRSREDLPVNEKDRRGSGEEPPDAEKKERSILPPAEQDQEEPRVADEE